MPVVLSDQAWQDLKRDHQKLALMVNRLYSGTHRHHAGQQRDAIWLGKADSSIAGGAEGTVSIWSGEPGAEEDTDRNKEECFNRSTTTINTGDWCLVREIRAKRYVLPFPSPSGVSFRNDSGETIPAYGVMRVEGSADVSGTECVLVDKPNTSLNRKYLVNGASTVANGAVGSGSWLENAGWVLYDDASTPAYGESWGPQNGSWELKKWRHGFTIVGNPSGGSTDIVRAWQEEVNQVHGQASGSISASGSSGSMTVFDGNGTTTSKTITVVNRTGIAIDNAAWCTATWIGGTWFIEPWVCPA